MKNTVHKESTTKVKSKQLTEKRVQEIAREEIKKEQKILAKINAKFHLAA